MSPLFQRAVQSKMLLTAQPLIFLEMVLGLFPGKMRFLQVSSIWKKRRSLKTMWFLRVSQKLAAGRDPNWSPGRKTGSVLMFYIVSDRDRLANKHVCPTFSRSRLAIMRELTLLWQHSKSKIRAGSESCAPYGTRGSIPGEVCMWRQVLVCRLAPPGSFWCCCKEPGTEQGEVRKEQEHELRSFFRFKFWIIPALGVGPRCCRCTAGLWMPGVTSALHPTPQVRGGKSCSTRSLHSPQPIQTSHSTLWSGNKTVISSGQALLFWFMFAIKHLLLKLINFN